MSKKKVWVDAGLIGMTIDLPNEELREISKDMRKIPKSPKVEREHAKDNCENKACHRRFNPKIY
ncbi:hypothetical protein [Metaclostridioides mangenotii]|uniref:hypothetical protein n=1 Tax=Metaclostridioides mangenotii TaxID=1540 RepID=UPI0026EDF1DC|nr:hypothetical protein [Clostridioides mangenotii]